MPVQGQSGVAIQWLRHETYVAGSTGNHGLQKENHVTDTDVTLPDKLNTFFARFEDNTVPLMRPATKDCGSPSPSPWPT